MGKCISFWGPLSGQAATTSNVLAVGTLLGAEYTTKKTLVTHTHLMNSTLEHGYFKKDSFTKSNLINFNDFGLDALARHASSKKLEPAMIQDYTHHVLNKLDILFGTKKNEESAEELNGLLKNIFENCSREYDLTLIDVISGTENPSTNTVLQNSDLIVVCLNQNVTLLDRFFIEKEWNQILREVPVVIMLGQYDRDSHLTIGNIVRKYKYKGPVYALPRCSNFMDAYNESSVAEFYMRNRNIDRRDGDYFFFEETRRMTKGILNHLGLNVKSQSDQGA